MTILSTQLLQRGRNTVHSTKTMNMKSRMLFYDRHKSLIDTIILYACNVALRTDAEGRRINPDVFRSGFPASSLIFSELQIKQKREMIE